jgi:hypothetical protein
MTDKNSIGEKTNKEALRAQAALLLSQARAQAISIRQALEAASANAPLHTRLAAAAAQISAAIDELSGSLTSSLFPLRPADLMALQSVVQSGETASLLTEAAAQAGTSVAREQSVAAAAADTRHEVQSLAHDVFDQHIFDPYLRFSSPEDEAQFRRREAEARAYINAQLARHTPEGDLNAGGGMIGAMLDANAHGAGASPQFMPHWNALVTKIQHQHAAMRAAGQSTAEFDSHVTASVRRFLKAKGLSDAEIDQRLRASADPLDAVKPFLGNDHDSQGLEHTLRSAADAIQTASPLVPPRTEAGAGATPADAPSAVHLDALGAKLKAAGVQISGTTHAGHGLTVHKPTDKAGPDIAG